MSDVVEKVEIGVDIVVDSSAAKKVNDELDKIKKAGEQAQRATGGDSDPAEKVRKAGDAAEQSGSKVGDALAKAGGFADSLASKLEEALGKSVATEWIRTVAQGLDVISQKVAVLGPLIWSMLNPAAQQAILTSIRVGWIGILRLFVSAKAAMGALAAAGSALALPIVAVVAVVGSLAYAWRSARLESEAALAEIAEADKKMRALAPRQIAQADRWHAGDRDILRNNVQGNLDQAARIGGSDSTGGIERFEQVFARINAARAETVAYEEQINSTLAKEEQVIGSVGNQLQAQIAIKQELVNIAKAEIQAHEDLVAALERQLAATRALRSEAEAGLAALQRQQDARLGVQEKLARLAPGQRDAGLAAFKEFQDTGSVEAGQRAEKILGFQIDAVGKALAKTIDVGNDVLDELGAKLNERDAELIAAVEKAAGGQGIEAIKAYIDSLAEEEAKTVAILTEAKSKLKSESARLNTIITTLFDEISKLSAQLIDAQRDANMGGQ